MSKFLLPIALILGACDSEQPDDADESEVAASEEQSSTREGRHKAKFAKLDTDGDGSLSKAELGDHRMAEIFDEIDGDGNGLLSQDEFFAAKKARHEGKKGRGHHGDPAERAAKMMEKLDANHDGAVTKDEVGDHRFLADKFAEIDRDADGKITTEELVAFKAEHRGRKGGKRSFRDAGQQAQG